jgi:hypothetical protein
MIHILIPNEPKTQSVRCTRRSLPPASNASSGFYSTPLASQGIHFFICKRELRPVGSSSTPAITAWQSKEERKIVTHLTNNFVGFLWTRLIEDLLG